MNSEQAIAEAKKLAPSYVAQDKNGDWWAYYNKPKIHGEHDYWYDHVQQESCIQISDDVVKKNPDWKNSLREVK